MYNNVKQISASFSNYHFWPQTLPPQRSDQEEVNFSWDIYRFSQVQWLLRTSIVVVVVVVGGGCGVTKQIRVWFCTEPRAAEKKVHSTFFKSTEQQQEQKERKIKTIFFKWSLLHTYIFHSL